jgi:hypothetical protein
MTAAPGSWVIERNHKMLFCIARLTADGKEFLCSASGRPSSFKTYAGARRALAAALKDPK